MRLVCLCSQHAHESPTPLPNHNCMAVTEKKMAVGYTFESHNCHFHFCSHEERNCCQFFLYFSCNLLGLKRVINCQFYSLTPSLSWRPNAQARNCNCFSSFSHVCASFFCFSCLYAYHPLFKRYKQTRSRSSLVLAEQRKLGDSFNVHIY